LKYQYEQFKDDYHYRTDNNKIRAFVSEYFQQYQVPFNPNEDIVTLNLPSMLTTASTKTKIRATFIKDVSIQSPESIEYITYDHEILQKIINYCQMFGTCGEYTLSIKDYNIHNIADLHNWSGMLFNFMVSLKSDKKINFFFSTIINAKGQTVLNLEDHPEEIFALPFKSAPQGLDFIEIEPHFKQARKILTTKLQQKYQQLLKKQKNICSEQLLVLDDYYTSKLLNDDMRLQEMAQKIAEEKNKLLGLAAEHEADNLRRKLQQLEKNYLAQKIKSIEHQQNLMREQQELQNQINQSLQIATRVKLISWAKVLFVD
jgi:hypothetical protein